MVKAKVNQQTIQETNDNSILSKASIAEHGYFHDPYLKLFCSKVVRRSPLIQRGYYIRARAMDYILKTFLQYCDGNRTQIVSLGAGFDTSYFRLKVSHLLGNSTYYDIDFPDVIRRKLNIIQKQVILMDVIGDFVIEEDDVLQSHGYYTIPCDVTDITKLEALFIRNKVDFTLPTLFFSECSLTYVEYVESKVLCKWIQHKFPNVSVMLYEQVNPNDAFGHIMLRHFEKIQSPLKRIDSLETISKQKDLFKELSYSATIGFDMNLFYNQCIDAKEKRRLETFEIFDEFEEWHLKCNHYCVVGAMQGECTDLKSKFIDQVPHITPSTDQLISSIKPCNLQVSQLQRFGHSCTKLNENSYLCTGGFGVTSNNRHDKLNDGFLLSFSTKCAGEFKVEVERVEMDMKNMYHSITCMSENMVFSFGGRTSPKQPKTEYGLYKVNDSMLIPHETYQLKLESSNGNGILQPTPRWRHAAVMIEDRVYISGGRSVTKMALNDLWSYELYSKTWKLEDLSEALKPCHTHTLDVWNRGLVVFGGLSDHEIVLNQLVIISLGESILKTEEVQFSEMLPPRYSHTSHLLRNNLYVIGGIDPSCSTQPPMLIISLIDRTWKAIHLPICDPSRPLMLHNHCSVLLDEHTIAIIGGGGNCFSFGTHFNSDVVLVDIPPL